MEVLTPTVLAGGGGGAGGSGGTPGGSDTQIQYNSAGSFAGSADLTWDDTAKELGVGGDINLDSGGTYSTTIQSVTPTANRTISFPDQTGTVGLVSGATGNIQFNDAGKLAGTGDLNTELNWVSSTGTYTALKVNADSNGGNPGTLLDLQVDGTSKVRASTTNSQLLVSDGAYGGGIQVVANFPQLVHENGTVAAVWNTGGRFHVPVELCIGGTGQANNDVILDRDAAGTLAQRNGTNAQTYRLYNTYTDANNYQRTSITDDSTGLVIDQQYAGTGAVRANLLEVKNNGVTKLSLGASGNGTFFYNNGGGGISVASNGAIGINENNNSVVNIGQVGAFAAVNLRTSKTVLTNGVLIHTPVAVSALPAAATVGAGARGFVSDSTVAASGNFGSVVSGGGANTVPVYSDGGAWRIG